MRVKVKVKVVGKKEGRFLGSEVENERVALGSEVGC